MLTSLFLLQSVVPSEAALPTILPRCTPSDPDEIVVCGTRGYRKYRLDPLPEPKSGFGKAEMTVGGGNVGVVAEQGDIGGIPTNRAMVRLKIKF